VEEDKPYRSSKPKRIRKKRIKGAATLNDDSIHKHYDSDDEHGDQQHEHGMNDNEDKRNITILAVVKNSSVENIDNVPQQDSSNEEFSSEETSDSADGFESNAELVSQEVFEGEAEIENSGSRESASNIPSMPTSSTLELEQQSSSSDREKQNST
jgi:hypothetical protein